MLKRLFLALLALTFAAGSGMAERIKYESQIEEAVRLMDEGKMVPSIRILRDVIASDSTNYYARYELGYAYYLSENYRQAVKTLEPLVDYPEANQQTYSILGGALDMAGDRQRAVDTYQAGLKRFPKSGMLWVELGTMALIDEDTKSALTCYLNAVKVEPDYTPGLYRSALLLGTTDNPELALCYAEMYFVKESENTQRLQDMSSLIVEKYRSVLQIDGDTVSVHLPRKTMTLGSDASANDFQKMMMRFDLFYGMAFERAAKQLGKVAELDAETLCRLRTLIADDLLTDELISDSRNPYLLHLRAVRASGCENAYNHYLLLAADAAALRNWVALNPIEWQKFVDWFSGYDATDGDYNTF